MTLTGRFTIKCDSFTGMCLMTSLLDQRRLILITSILCPIGFKRLIFRKRRTRDTNCICFLSYEFISGSYSHVHQMDDRMT